jgi:hypothetical protein
MIITKARVTLIGLAAAASIAIGAVPLPSTASALPRGGGPSVTPHTNITFCADMQLLVQQDADTYVQAQAAGDSAGAAAAAGWYQRDLQSARNARCAGAM